RLRQRREIKGADSRRCSQKTVSEGTLAQKGLPFSENPAGTCRFAGISFLFSRAGTGQFSFPVG
ncbi:hypothetical protein, partial [Eisenbergiella porci]|uniref:hypothetical protein n=1 Tax=Eisenbergiella porci TaxID=2652274 RepID=UPI002A7EE498